MSLNKVGGLGASEIGSLFTKEGVDARTAKTKALEKAIEIVTGFRKTFDTAATKHGIFSEEEAFQNVVYPIFGSTASYQASTSIPIKEGLWATPDVVGDDFVLDIKCPYTVTSFFKNINSIPTTYIIQLHQQALATEKQKAFLCLYLTSTEWDDFGNKIEYDLSIEDRHRIIPIDIDDTIQEEIFTRFDKWVAQRDKLVEHLSEAKEINDKMFYELHTNHNVTEMKDKSNYWAWKGHLVFNKNKLYVIE